MLQVFMRTKKIKLIEGLEHKVKEFSQKVEQ